MTRSNDPAVDPVQPQFALGATADEANMHQQLVRSPLEGPGGIVNRLTNQQWQFPRASPDANMSDRPGINVGES